MKHFTAYKLGYIRPKGKNSWYIIRTDGLKVTNIDCTPTLLHLISKNWFTSEMFFELLTYAKKKYKSVDFSQVIFEAGRRFYKRELFENNADGLRYLNMLNDIYISAEKLAIGLDDNEKEVTNV